MAYSALIFSVFWFVSILVIDVVLLVNGTDWSVAKISIYTSVPSMLAGLGFWSYLKAAAKSDDNKQS